MRANYKKTAIILGLSVILIGGVGTIFAKKINNNVSINAQAQENKKEEEKIVNYVGTNEEGKKYTYDAKKVQEKLKEPPQNIAVVGDQIFTDIVGGNRCKMFTILVEPIAEKDIWITMVKRPLENAIKKKYHKNIDKGSK